MERVRDRFWVWGHDAGSHNHAWGLPAPSRMTPTEGAFYLGVPNLVMVRYDNRPAPPYRQYALPFRALKQVVWSVVGAGGKAEAEDRSAVLALADELPNMAGVMMDDFFRRPSSGNDVGALSVRELEAMRRELTAVHRELALWVVLYDHQLGLPVQNHLRLCDIVSFWTWHADGLADLERNLDRVDILAPTCGKVLGCYMWDYGQKRPMPMAAMERQCTLGLRWLREGRIQGMVFLATCICDLELETVEWTRSWVVDVGEESL